MNKNQIFAIGKRKNAVARVQLDKGSGKIIINDKEAKEFFPNGLYYSNMLQPLILTDNVNKFDFVISVKGGGISGQVEAICHGISLALIEFNEDFRLTLRKYGFVTRDSRIKERKKYGLKGARKAPQYSKR